MRCGTCNRGLGIYRLPLSPIVRCPSCRIPVCYVCARTPEGVFHLDNCEEEAYNEY